MERNRVKLIIALLFIVAPRCIHGQTFTFRFGSVSRIGDEGTMDIIVPIVITINPPNAFLLTNTVIRVSVSGGNATEGEDFTLSRNEEVFGIGAANGNTMSILVDILPDPLVERTECFTLAGTIGTPAAPGSTFVGGDVTICINDNNMALLEFTQQLYSVRENLGPLAVNLRLASNSPTLASNLGTNPIQVRVFSDGTGSAIASPNPGADYNPVSTLVSFKAGDGPLTLSQPQVLITIIDDDSVEQTETFGLAGTITSGAALAQFVDNTSTVQIIDDGPPPVLPGCMGPLFPADRETVNVGCPICIPQGTYVNLDCDVMSENTTEIEYSWERDNVTVSTARILQVRFEGSYTCTATNLDGMDSATTDVYFSPQITFSTSIETLHDTTLTTESGCQRLRNTTEIPGVDRCALVGERITFQCQGNGIAVENITIIDPMGQRFDSPYSVNVSTDTSTGNYTCELDTESPCGGTIGMLNLAIYEPARINRSVPLPPSTQTNMHIGAGRPQQSVVITQGNTATLYCPATGIGNPTTRWWRIRYNSQGRPVEEPLMSSSAVIDGIPTEILVITPFDSNDVGSYVCRTNNTAGQDAAVVTLVEAESGVWTLGPFSACQPYDCNQGTQTRSVVCRSDRDNRVLPDRECPQPKPATTRQCTGPCFTTPTWRAFAWGPCSKGCGGGYRSRTVVCHIPRTGVVVPNSRCSGTMPPRYESCRNTCCVSDDYPTLCSEAGTDMCGMNGFQQSCCWTCQRRDGPPPTPQAKKVGTKH